MNPIFPSILSVGYTDLESKLRTFASLGIEAIHLDVMDGHFVPNLSFGPSVVHAVKKTANFTVDAHLMVDNPSLVIPWFIEAGSDWISIHTEVKDDIRKCLTLIHQAKRKAGLVINPNTDVKTLFPYLSEIDYCLLMSVFPGYGGQSFIPDTLDRILAVKNEILRIESRCLIQVDGGLNKDNVQIVSQAGADLFVVGTALCGADDMGTYLKLLLTSFGEKK